MPPAGIIVYDLLLCLINFLILSLNLSVMEILIKVLIAVVAVLHSYFLYLEMFAWTTRGPKVFKTIPAGQFAATKTMAGN